MCTCVLVYLCIPTVDTVLIKHIFVIGAGTMGNGIAQVAATSGYEVTCMDVMPAALEKAKAIIAKSTTNAGSATSLAYIQAIFISLLSQIQSPKPFHQVLRPA